MKLKCVFANVIMLSLFCSSVFSQNENYSFVPTSNLTITCNKTTNLIFPSSVQSVDRGSRDILVQQPKGTENIIQLKADKPNFIQTNLSVITSDGNLYSFIVDYALQPAQLNIVVQRKFQISVDPNERTAVQLSSTSNKLLFKTIAQKIDTSKIVNGKKTSVDQIQLKFGGIYINEDVIYFRLLLKNSSNISYDVDNIRFSIKDRQKSTRTATQELELTPLYTYNAFSKVAADSFASCIMAFPKFTLPNSKYLSVEVLEKDGSRDLNMVLKEHHLEHAKIITE
jgi:conjugative transposon TraN protein